MTPNQIELSRTSRHLLPHIPIVTKVLLMVVSLWIIAAPTLAIAGDPPYEMFDSIVNRFSNNPSEDDRPKLRKAALTAMKHAFLYNDLPEPSIFDSDWQSETQFRKRMISLWMELARAIGKDEPERERVLVDLREEITDALDWGNIPIPNIEHDEQYRYTYLRQYFPLGISPIPVEKYENESLAIREEHPIRTHFLSSRLRLLEHDVQHARFLGRAQDSLGITTVEKRKRLLDCFQSVPGESDVKSSVRLSNYYLLHEDLHSFFPADRRGLSISVRGYSTDSFVEFALEKTILKSGLSLQTLLEGKTALPSGPHDDASRAASRKRTCGAVNSMVNFSAFQLLIPEYEFNAKLNQYLGLPKVGDLDRKKMYTYVSSGLRSKLIQLCFGLPWQRNLIPNSASAQEIAEGLDILKANFQTAARKDTGDKFSVVFFEEMRKLQEGVDFVQDYIRSQTNKACTEFKFPSLQARTSRHFLYHKWPELAPYLDNLQAGFENLARDHNYIALDEISKLGLDEALVIQALPDIMLEDPEIQARIRKYLTSADPKSISAALIFKIFSQPFAADWDDELVKVIPGLNTADARTGFVKLLNQSPRKNWKQSFRALAEVGPGN